MKSPCISLKSRQTVLKKLLLSVCALSLVACSTMDGAPTTPSLALSPGISYGRPQISPSATAEPSSEPSAEPTMMPMAEPSSVSDMQPEPMATPTAAPTPTPTPDTSGEGYARLYDNPFLNAQEAPFSTFSIDVDTASYSNLRRFINGGQLPPPDAVRIEEMLNYFSYTYPEPTGEHPFALHTELTQCPWKPENRLLKIGMKAKEIDMREAPANNLVFLIDVSGSMSWGQGLPLVKASLKLLVENMRPQDRVAIVVYAGAAGQVLPSTPGTQKDKIIAALDQLEAGGSTAGAAGIELAYRTAWQNLIPGGNNRVILATDGDFNVGLSSQTELQRLIEQKRNEGIFLTALGYGMGNYQDQTLETLANKGNGNYAYIDDLTEARKVLVEELGGTLYTVAKDVKLQLEFNPARVASYRLIGYENRLLNTEDFADDSKDAGELGAGHTVTALYEVVPASGTATASDNFGTDDWLHLDLRYKHPEQSNSILLRQPVTQQALSWDQASTDMRFAASVAGLGMLLRQSEHKGNTTFNRVLSWGEAGLGTDPGGYRAAYLTLVREAMTLAR